MPDSGIYGRQYAQITQSFPKLLLTLSDMLSGKLFLLISGLLGLVALHRKIPLLLAMSFMGFYILFGLVGFRTYYLPVMVMILVLNTSQGIQLLPKNIARITMLMVVALSLVASYRSVYAVELLSNPQSEEYGRSSEPAPSFSLERAQSLSISYWLDVQGWQALQTELQNIDNDEMILYDPRVSMPRVRWYAGIHPVRSNYDKNYSSPTLIALDTADLECNQDFWLVGFEHENYVVCDTDLQLVSADYRIAHLHKVALYKYTPN